MFSTDGTLISASAAPHCGDVLEEKNLSPLTETEPPLLPVAAATAGDDDDQ